MGRCGLDRLGDLGEAGLWFRLDCRRCGHAKRFPAHRLYKTKSPSTPWRWLRFKCDDCGSSDIAMQVGPPHRLDQGPVLLTDREDLREIMAKAIFHNLAAGVEMGEPKP